MTHGQELRNGLSGDLGMLNSAEPLPRWKGTHLLESVTVSRELLVALAGNRDTISSYQHGTSLLWRYPGKSVVILAILLTLWRQAFSRAILLLIKLTKRNSGEPCTCSVSCWIKLVPASSNLSNTTAGKPHLYYPLCERPQLSPVTALS